MTDATSNPASARFSEEQMRQHLHLMVQAQAVTVPQPVTDDQLDVIVQGLLAMIRPMQLMWPEGWDDDKALKTVRQMLLRQISK